MRWAIRRLVSRGKSVERPRAVRDSEALIMNWPERIKTQPHDDRDNCFLHFDSKGPCGMTVNNDIDDDSATKHSDSTEAIQVTTARKARDQLPSSLPPPSPTSLQDKRDKGGSTFGHRGGGALEGTLASLDFVENISNRRGSRREVGGAEQR